MYKINFQNKIEKINNSKLILDITNSKKYNNIFLICDSNIHSLYYNHEILNSSFNVIIIEDRLESKNLNTINYIVDTLVKGGATRDSLLIGLGGGNITDIVGLVASIYNRGIDHVFIPTTLLGMVDASIGGKTGVNFNNIKNLIGTFKNPQATYIDVNFLSTLKRNDIIDGFAEIIKYGLIFDEDFFDTIYEKFNYLITLDDINDIEKIIIQSCQYKLGVVLKDQLDTNERMVLNFGHTIGHALEACFKDHKISHGQAVYYGMVIESCISFKMGFLSEKKFKKINDFLFSIITYPLNSIDNEEILKFIKFDKKQLRNKMHFILLKDIGQGIIENNVDSLIIKNAIKEVLD